MNGKMVLGALALPTALLGGYVLGYSHGYQDALDAVWNLRKEAQCLDSAAKAGGVETSGESIPATSRWVWKRGPFVGEPVNSWPHTFFTNPFRRVPLFETFGDRLERYATVDVANWHPVK